MKPKLKKQAVKKQPTKSKELVKVTLELSRDVAAKLKNVSGVTGRSMKAIADQAFRGLFGMPVLTIEEEIKNLEK